MFLQLCDEKPRYKSSQVRHGRCNNTGIGLSPDIAGGSIWKADEPDRKWQ